MCGVFCCLCVHAAVPKCSVKIRRFLHSAVFRKRAGAGAKVSFGGTDDSLLENEDIGYIIMTVSRAFLSVDDLLSLSIFVVSSRQPEERSEEGG